MKLVINKDPKYTIDIIEWRQLRQMGLHMPKDKQRWELFATTLITDLDALEEFGNIDKITSISIIGDDGEELLPETTRYTVMYSMSNTTKSVILDAHLPNKPSIHEVRNCTSIVFV